MFPSATRLIQPWIQPKRPKTQPTASIAHEDCSNAINIQYSWACLCLGDLHKTVLFSGATFFPFCRFRPTQTTTTMTTSHIHTNTPPAWWRFLRVLFFLFSSIHGFALINIYFIFTSSVFIVIKFTVHHFIANSKSFVFFSFHRMCTIFFSDVTSFVAALLFAVHPIHIEAVSLPTQLPVFFSFSCERVWMLCYSCTRKKTTWMENVSENEVQ